MKLASVCHWSICIAASWSVQASAAAQCRDFSGDFAVSGQGLGSTVGVLAVLDDGSGAAMYAAGAFGAPYARLLEWTGAGWTVLENDLNSNGSVSALAAWDDGTGVSIYAFGNFTAFGGITANRAAKLTPSGWAALGSGLNGQVDCALVFDDGSGPKLYVGGGFTTAGSVAASRIARWDGAAWSALGAGLTAAVSDLCVFDDGSGPRLFAAGSFANRVRYWDGSTWQSAGAGLVLNSAASLLVFDDGGGAKLYAGGTGTTIAGATVARRDGGAWTMLPALQGLNKTVEVLASFDDCSGAGVQLYAGGYFNVDPVSPNGLVAKWNGTSWSPLNICLSNDQNFDRVMAMCSFDDGAGERLYLGGRFDFAGSWPSSNIARWGEACSPPVVTSHPQNLTALFVNNNALLSLSTSAEGTGPLAYQWRKDGIALADDARISGSSEATLSIDEWNYSDAGEYDCVISGLIGQVTSDVATLDVPLGNPVGLPIQLDAVLYPPEQVPNLPSGTSYVSVDPPLVAPNGECAFVATITGTPSNRRSIHMEDDGALEFVHGGGDAAPGCEAGAHFSPGAPGGSAFSAFAVASGRRIVFSSGLSGTTLPNGTSGIWFRDDQGTVLVARNGADPAGCAVGETWRSLTPAVLNEAGQLLFAGFVFNASNVNVGTGLWSWDSVNACQLLLRTGSTGIGTSATFINMSGTRNFALNNAGQIALVGQVDSQTGYSYGGGLVWDRVIWSGYPGALQLIAKSGDTPPGLLPNVNIEVIDHVWLEQNGDVVFASQVAGPSGYWKTALFRWQQGSLQTLITPEDPVPNSAPGTVFFNPQVVDVNADGDLLVSASITGGCDPCPTRGLFMLRQGVLTTIATNRADPLSGAPSNSAVSAFETGALNDAGDVAFQCILYASGSTRGVFGWNAEDGLFPLMVPGFQMEIAPGVYRTVSSSRLAGQNNASPLEYTSPNLTEDGELTIRFSFTDGSTGIYRGSFGYLRGLQFGPATAFCAGDGTGASCPCGNSGASGEGCANSTGVGALLQASGTARISADDLTFDVSSLPPNISALLFQGSNTLGGGNGLAFKDGLKCAGGVTRRFGLDSSGATGTASWGPGLATQGQWLVGQTGYIQAWYRDGAGSPCAKFSNMTNALAVTFVP